MSSAVDISALRVNQYWCMSCSVVDTDVIIDPDRIHLIGRDRAMDQSCAANQYHLGEPSQTGTGLHPTPY